MSVTDKDSTAGAAPNGKKKKKTATIMSKIDGQISEKH